MKIEIEREQDERWIAEVPDLPGVMVHGTTRQSAVAKAEALALRVIVDRLDHGEAGRNSPNRSPFPRQQEPGKVVAA